MSAIFPKLSTLIFLDAHIAALWEGSFLSLYQNDVDPDADTVLADLDPADFDGFAPIELVGWPGATLNPDDKAQTELPQQDFTCTGSSTPNDIFGIFILSATGDLLLVERNPATFPITMNTSGQIYGYVPRITERSET